MFLILNFQKSMQVNKTDTFRKKKKWKQKNQLDLNSQQNYFHRPTKILEFVFIIDFVYKGWGTLSCFNNTLYPFLPYNLLETTCLVCLNCLVPWRKKAKKLKESFCHLVFLFVKQEKKFFLFLGYVSTADDEKNTELAASLQKWLSQKQKSLPKRYPT